MHCSSPRLWKKIRRRKGGKKINLLCCSSDYVVPGVGYEIECYLLKDEPRIFVSSLLQCCFFITADGRVCLFHNIRALK